jgi:hypothetical protein
MLRRFAFVAMVNTFSYTYGMVVFLLHITLIEAAGVLVY